MTTPFVTPDEAMDTLAFQIEKIRNGYLAIEGIVTDYTWARQDGDKVSLSELAKQINEEFTALDLCDRVTRNHITKILDGSVTVASSKKSAIDSGVDDEVGVAPLPPSSPRAKMGGAPKLKFGK